MAWQIEYRPDVEKVLRKMGPQDASRVLRALEQIAALNSPRQRGKALAGEFAGMWRYRIGDWRVIAKIEDRRLVIIVIALGHRREVYRR